jgi:predicted N-formylglutamate amidohydrolase
MTPAPVVSCEHGGNRVPAGFPRTRKLLEALPTHRGWDPGALPLARHIATRLRAPLRYSTMSRLIVDPNRSEGHEGLFSEWSRGLPLEERRRLVTRYHRRFRHRVRRAIEMASEGGRRSVVHLAVHTFTPVLGGEKREVDVGILFDPEREFECRVAELWRTGLAARRPELRVRFNEPYDGRSDGLTTTLRSAFDAAGVPDYAGIELEVNQALIGLGGRFPHPLAVALTDTLADLFRHLSLHPSPRPLSGPPRPGCLTGEGSA